jgi:hypothetical protein
MLQFHANLKKVKAATKKWATTFNLRSQVVLKEIELKINSLFKANASRTFFKKEASSLKILMDQRQELLTKDEATWRLKSRVVWLSEGENNTTFFHKYANYQKNLNTIWEVANQMGFMVKSFKEKSNS